MIRQQRRKPGFTAVLRRNRTDLRLSFRRLQMTVPVRPCIDDPTAVRREIPDLASLHNALEHTKLSGIECDKRKLLRLPVLADNDRDSFAIRRDSAGPNIG